MSVSLNVSFASGKPSDTDDYTVYKIFTIFQIDAFTEPVVKKVSDVKVGDVTFTFTSKELKKIFRNRWYLFVRHDRHSFKHSDLKILSGAFTLADFTVTIDIDDTEYGIDVSDTPVHIIPC